MLFFKYLVVGDKEVVWLVDRFVILGKVDILDIIFFY